MTPLFPQLLRCAIAAAAVVLLPRVYTAGAEPDAEAGTAVERLHRRDTFVHDPSTIVKCKGEYWLFATGRGIVSRRSKDLIAWQAGPPVFTTRPAWTTNAVPGNRGGDQGDFWAPDVIQLTNRYLLNYSVSTFGRKISAIGLVTNPTLDPADPNYHWTDQGMVIQTGGADDFNAIDPAVTQAADGSLWLSFGSFWSGIKLIQLDPSTGNRIAPGSPVYSLARYSAIEASYLHRHNGHYYLFLDWDRCCRGTNSTYNIRVGRSEKITGPYLDKAGKDMLQGGGSLLLGTVGPFIGPGHPGIFNEGGTNWFSCHFYDGSQGGRSVLGLGQLEWGADGWPLLKVARSQTSADRNRE